MENIYITSVSDETLQNCKNKLIHAVFLKEETRQKHSAIYPLHNRYFSNGDKPWVILINMKNNMKLHYDGKKYIVKENELVLFDDNVMHGWEMYNNDLKIYYYRAKSEQPVMRGTYCLDDYF